MKYVPKNSRDIVERLTDRNAFLEEKVKEYENNSFRLHHLNVYHTLFDLL